MACSCKGKRQQWEVVADGGAGRVLFTSGSQATANAVSKRYSDSIVREKGMEEPATAQLAVTTP